MKPRIGQTTLLIGLLAVLSTSFPVVANGPNMKQPVRTMTLLAPGTIVNSAANGSSWNRMILLAKPQINSGDVDALSQSIRIAATKCSLTIMAGVQATASSGNSGTSAETVERPHRLAGVGVGYSIPIEGRQVVVTADSASDLGADLGFVESQVLSRNQKHLAEVKLVYLSTTLAIFDAPSILYRLGTHRKYQMRHLLWIDPQSGKGATLAWLMKPAGDEDSAGIDGAPYRIINESIRLVTWGTRESRKIHVDKSEFNFFGIPGEMAFALEDLPPGRKLAWTPRAARVAGLRTFSAAEVSELSASMNDVIDRSATSKPLAD